MESLPAAALAWSLVHFLWQGAAIGLAALALMRLLRRSTQARYAVGVLALVAMAAAPVVTFVALVDHPGGTMVRPARFEVPAAAGEPADAQMASAADSAVVLSSHTAAASSAGPRATAGSNLVLIVPVIWLAGVVVLSLRLLGGLVVARRLGARGVGPVAPDVSRLAATLAARLAIGRAVRLYESSRAAVPMVLGWWRPVILLPAAAIGGLSPTQLEALLAHELAHVRRHDYLVNLLQAAIETLLFYHPAVWWVSRQVRIEREHCCDEVAVRVCDRLVYASALAELAAMRSTPRLALAATDGRLLDRIRRLLGQPARSASALTFGAGALLVAVLFVGLAAVPMAIRAVERPRAENTSTGVSSSELDQDAPAYDPTAPTRTGSGRWRHSVDGQMVELHWTGPFRVSEDGRRIEWIEPGQSVQVTDGSWWFATGVEIKALEDGTLEPHYFRGGFERAFEPAGREYLATALERLIARAGLAAPARVARLLQDGGPARVREAIAGFESESVRRVYYRELIRQANLPAAEIAALVQEAATTMRSDSQVSSLITSTAPAVAGDEDATIALIAATRAIDSDASQVRALQALLSDQPSPRVAAAVLDAAASLGSDAYRSRTLQDVATRGGLTAETRPAFFALVNGMQSSSHRGRLLTAVGAGSDVPAVTVHAVLDASRHIASDSERRRVVASTMSGERIEAATAPQVLQAVVAVENSAQRAALLEEFVEKGGLTGETAQAFFGLVASMSSGAYQRRVLDDVIAQTSLPAPVVSGFLEAAASVRGDSERTRVLLAFIERHPVAGADRERYLAAADGIGSETSQNRVLAALVRAERGRR